MYIRESQLSLESQHSASRSLSQQESLTLFRVNGDGEVTESVQVAQTKVSLSEQARALAQRIDGGDNLRNGSFQDLSERPVRDLAAGSQSLVVNSGSEEAPGANLDSRTRLMKGILEAITGREIQLFATAEQQTSSEESVALAAEVGAVEVANSGPERVGLRYQYTEIRQEQESTQFSAEGRILTTDGQEIEIDLELAMSRSFVERNHLEIEAGARLKDPLVINFDGRAAELTTEKFDFDIDADGELDQISFVTSHSGMLALDRNGDGRINDGSELFGALSGNGFADLKAFDQDGNSFIDEADPSFQQLKIWVKQADGSDLLLDLKEGNVGALYLGSTETPFDLKDSDNQLQGRIRSTGVFLSEQGQAGTLQQIDLVV
ncbi:MAG: hypothetical protein OQK12_05620 [Motiliproteus sp.]|nr:hypothetical protein [Motiliproteus sp.]MCW9052110.1 hypothetical protein [Motiliproteus sp.]